MSKLVLLTDGSVNTKSGIGIGAYMAIREPIPDEEQPQVKLKHFENTSSSRLELQTLLWALGEIPDKGRKIVVYTDSQTIVGLKDRRSRLVRKEFKSSKGAPLKNADLYKEFYKLTDQLDCELVKVKGHQPGNQKGQIDLLFEMVDRAARRALREDERNT